MPLQQHKIKVHLLSESSTCSVLFVSLLLNRQVMLLLKNLRKFPADRGPFDEGAAQVKKLLTRDKRELMGVEQIGQRARTEFDEEDSKPSTSGSDNGFTVKENTRLFGEGLVCCCSPAMKTSVCDHYDKAVSGAGRDRSKPTSSPFGGSTQGAKRAANPFGPDSRSKPFIEPAN